MNFKKALSFLYILLSLFCLSLISYISYYLYASTIDGNFNSFFKTALESLKLNYYSLNGRWAQGLTNDFRFHTNRFIVTTINNAFFLYSIYYLVKQLFKKHAVITAVVIYFTFLFNAHNLYQVTHLLNTSLSYTFGMSLMFIFFGVYFRYIRIQDKFTKLSLVLSFIILFFITGLVEHLFMIMLLILGYLVLEDIIFSLKKKKLKISRLKLSYVITTLAGSLLVVFSVGSQKKRNLTSTRLETTEYSGIFDVNRYLKSLGSEMLDQLNINSLLFLIFMFLILSFAKQKKNIIFAKTDQKQKAILFLLFTFALTVTPITVGFLASNGKVGMPKAYNLTAILFLLFLTALAYVINVYTKIKRNKKVLNVALTLPLIFYVLSYIFSGNNLYKQKDQVFSGNMRASSEEEYARRQYLIETNNLYQEKVIPKLSKKYHNKVYAAHKYLKMTRYYCAAFNNGIPIYTDKNLPSSLEFTSIYLVKNNKLKPVFNQGDYQVFYNKHLHTLIIKNSNSLFNQTITQFNLDVENMNSKKSKVQVNLKSKLKEKPLFYKENPNYIAIVLPRETKKVSINQFENCNLNFEDETLQDSINYNFEYGNIMR